MRLEGCTKGFCTPIGPALIDNQKICVSMKNCSGKQNSQYSSFKYLIAANKEVIISRFLGVESFMTKV